MINITLNDLNADNFYQTLLQTIEDICDNYDLLNHFGTISTANQQVVDYVLSNSSIFTINLFISIENDNLSFTYEWDNSLSDLFNRFPSPDNQCYEILSSLIDDVDYNVENKNFTISFHVKPKFNLHRENIKQAQYKTLNL